MASAAQIAATKPEQSGAGQPFYSISDLAERWRCSRGSVYNRLRGERVVDFAAPGPTGPQVNSPGDGPKNRACSSEGASVMLSVKQRGGAYPLPRKGFWGGNARFSC